MHLIYYTNISKMSKIKSLLAALLLTPATVFAGGLLTNTNQNAAFLRQMSQDAIIDITGLYANPAGTAFLNNGWHLSLDWQIAAQNRNITTSFPLFAFNAAAPGQTTREFKGEAFAPVIPSFQLSYNHDKWSVSAAFAVCGGGGKCEFDKGLGSFEALYSSTLYGSVVPTMVEAYAQAAVPQLIAAGMPYADAVAKATADGLVYANNNFGYSMDSYMKGRQYNFGLQLGATYKALDNLAFFGGLRVVYANNNYNGYVRDVKYYVAGNPTSVPADLTLDCDQTGWGVTPILGVDWKINEHWNLAAKYEFKTRMRLKNSTTMNAYAQAQVAAGNATLAQFADGESVANDIPGILFVGAQYSPIKPVRINAGFHYYFDKSATTYGDKQDLIDNNTWELTAGAEWDICKWITVSASWQSTNYGLSDAYMNDLSFNLSSNALGLGCRINACERCSIDVGYMHNFYKDRTVTTPTAIGDKVDLYKRTNDVVGVGVNLKF